ncbi:MAG: hypothetical protein SFT92_09190 [Rickettsiales bacterium]|nr:hypothetical protein [Rickettsiales bacterium]
MGKLRIWSLLFLALCLILVIVLRFGFLFMLLAMLPSIVAWFIDQTPKKQIFNTVFAANLAGTLSPMTPMVSSLLHLQDYDITPLMKDPAVWLVIYASAAAGWGLVFFCHSVARFIISLVYAYRAIALENKQELLIAEWGKEIVGTQKPQ